MHTFENYTFCLCRGAAVSTPNFLQRYFSSRSRIYCLRYLVINMSKWSHPQEIRIPNSYGYIAAKAWGKEQHEPVLALHGWQDNAGTFDRLIPLLSQDLFIVTIDAPGHGLSSHMPPGTFYQYMQNLVEIKQIIDYMKWDTVSFIGHSLGGQIAILFSSIYPDRVKNVVLLDIIKPTSYEIDEIAEYTRRNVEHFLELEEKHSSKAPVYSLEEAHRRLMAGLSNQVTEDGVDILLKRACRPSKCGKGVMFSRDIRLQVGSSMQPINHGSLKGYLQNVECNLLMILGTDTPNIISSTSPEVLDEFINFYKKTCRSFKLEKIDGNHFVHLNNPERVAPLIDAFFEENLDYKLSKI